MINPSWCNSDFTVTEIFIFPSSTPYYSKTHVQSEVNLYAHPDEESTLDIPQSLTPVISCY